MTEGGRVTDDKAALTALNSRFIEAFRLGSWELLEPILSPSFSYLDGATGEVWAHERYVEDLRSNPAPALSIDQVAVHVDGDTAVATWHVENSSRGRILARGFEKVGIAHRLVARHDRLPEIKEDAREVVAPPSGVLVLAGVVRHSTLLSLPYPLG